LNNKLHYHFDQLERDRQHLLTEIKDLSVGELNASPSRGQWSISQVVAHLFTAENASLSYMKKKSLGVSKLKNSGWVESFKVVLLKLSQRLPLKYKAPKYVVENTPLSMTFDELETEWRNVRDDLKKFLEGIEDKNLRKMIYKHPVAGYLDTVQALDFFREHIRHHRPQLKRLIRNVKR
jgi:uncharacterized damage-inducible protein DinB